MDLLPKTSSDFSQLEYWNKFFKSRGSQAFEWYGTYPQLCSILHKYLSPRDNILVGGCGNSTLSVDLYNAGFQSLTNVDISEKVIQQMNLQYSQTHPLMKFLTMDLLKMDFADSSFTSFLDKGTLDALMSENSKEATERAMKMFQEIDRVLKFGGRYICVSLLQEHILKCFLSHFHQLGWMIRVCRCEDAERNDEDVKLKKKKTMERYPFPVFVVVCTKFKKMNNVSPIVEYSPSDSSVERLASLELLMARVKSVQQFALLCHNMSRENQATEDNFIELMDPKSGKDTPKYTLFVVDRRRKSKNKFAAFVVPQGRETEWMFSADEGRRQLAANADFQRLLVIHLGRDHLFDCLESVQNELAAVVSSLQPSDLPPNSKIPFLSLGSEVNQRREIHRGVSDLTGEFVVDEVEEEEGGGNKKTILRRLIFLSNPNIIQSEARLIKGKVDLGYLSCQHHHVMVETYRQQCFDGQLTPSKVLVLGLGGGALCSYLHHKFPGAHIDGVDIDPSMPPLANKYFGFVPGAHLRAHISDGVQFVKDAAAAGGSDERYRCIMVDVDCKDRTLGMSCPPPAFVEPTFIEAVKKALAPNGVFLLNLVCRDTARRADVMEMLNGFFTAVKTKKIQDEVNEIITCHDIVVT